MNFFIGWCTGILVGILACILATLDLPTHQQVGKTYKELKDEQTACEASLPRNKHCKVVINWEVVGND